MLVGDWNYVWCYWWGGWCFLFLLYVLVGCVSVFFFVFLIVVDCVCGLDCGCGCVLFVGFCVGWWCCGVVVRWLVVCWRCRLLGCLWLLVVDWGGILCWMCLFMYLLWLIGWFRWLFLLVGVVWVWLRLVWLVLVVLIVVVIVWLGFNRYRLLLIGVVGYR